MVEVREYLDAASRSYFGSWFDKLNAPAAAKVAMALKRLGQGNFSKVKGVGSGVYEYTVDFGPGYRIYFGKEGDEIVVLLGGGSKARQQRDISAAIELWREYKKAKK
jgi:putative addiction module killer protein